MKKILPIFGFLASVVLGTSTVYAQGCTRVTQNGNVAPLPNRHLAMFFNNCIIGDAGSSAGAATNGLLPSDVGIQGPLGIWDGLNSQASHQALFQWKNGNFDVGLNAFGASVPTMTITVNGVSYPFPGAGNGNAMLPVSPAIGVGDIAVGNGGTNLKDGGSVGHGLGYWGCTSGATVNTTTTCLVNALQSGDRVYIDAIYQFSASGAVSIAGCPKMEGLDPATQQIQFTGAVGGLVITCSNPAAYGVGGGRVSLHNFGIITTAAAGGTALTINFSGQLGEAQSPNNLDLNGLWISGSPRNTAYWSDNIEIKNAQGIIVTNNFISGQSPSGTTSSLCGLCFSNDSGVPIQGAKIDNNYVYFATTAIKVTGAGSPAAEGYVVSNNILVNNNTGISLSSAGYVAPVWRLVGNQTNSAVVSIALSGTSSVEVGGNDIQTNGATSSGLTCTGVGVELSIHDNVVFDSVSSSGTGVSLGNCAYATVTSNKFQNYAIGISGTNTVGVQVSWNTYISVATTVSGAINIPQIVLWDNGVLSQLLIGSSNQAELFASDGANNPILILGFQNGTVSSPHIDLYHQGLGGSAYDARIQSSGNNELDFVLNGAAPVTALQLQPTKVNVVAGASLNLLGGPLGALCNQQTHPTSSNTSFTFCDNFTAGAGEIDIFNDQASGATTTLNVYQKTGASTETLVFSIAPNGAATFGAPTGGMSASAGVINVQGLEVNGVNFTQPTTVSGVSFPSNPSTNTVPVVTGANTITYEAVPNAALANSTMTIAGHSIALGGTQAIAIGDLTSVAGGTVAGNTTSGSAGMAATQAPVLGIAGSATGSLGLCASGVGGQCLTLEYLGTVAYTIKFPSGDGTNGQLLSTLGTSSGLQWTSPTVTLGSTGLTLGSTVTTVAGLTLTTPTVNNGIFTTGTWVDNQACNQGQMSSDANYIYICVSTNTVKRATLNTF